MGFEELWKKNANSLYAFVMTLVGDRTLAEEICQRTVTKAYCNFYQLRNKDKFRSWIYSIAKNEFYMMHKKDKHHMLSDFDNLNRIIDDRIQDTFSANEILNKIVIKDFLSKFQPKWQKAFIMYFYYGFKKTEIAKIIGVSSRVVRYRLHQMGLQAYTVLQGGEANWENVKNILKEG